MVNQQHLSLSELNGLVADVVATVLSNAYWVVAEISELRVVGGHCYMSLIEKDEQSNTPVAKAAARCWRNQWLSVSMAFEQATHQQLIPGMKVLMQVKASFHVNYGFAWVVQDIDPSYTLGDMARKRQEIIRQLKAEGMFDANRQLSLPLFAQRIAVISSAQAAGYGDFARQLSDNAYGYAFHTTLFAAVMQGEEVERSVIEALNAINARINEFDCVVIIRGGGAVSDLSGFDTLSLARNVANFELPVITGIGHERDESVLDMIAHTRVKTPTAAAAFLIDHLHHTAERIERTADALVRMVSQRMENERWRLQRLSSAIPSLFAVVKMRYTAHLDSLMARAVAVQRQFMEGQRHRLLMAAQRLPMAATQVMIRQHHLLEMLQQRTKAVDPKLLLQRGYSITLHCGKTVRDPSQLPQGAHVTTIFEKGQAEFELLTPNP